MTRSPGKRALCLQERALVNAKSTGYPLFRRNLNSEVARLRMTERSFGSEVVMKRRAAGGVGLLLTCLLATTCNTQTPGSPSLSNQARVKSAENTPPNPALVPPAVEGKKLKPSPAAQAPAASGAKKKVKLNP